MSGHHNIRIYTKDDNPWCETCINSEHISGEFIFEDGGYICWAKGNPTKDSCKDYGKETDGQAKKRGHIEISAGIVCDGCHKLFDLDELTESICGSGNVWKTNNRIALQCAECYDHWIGHC